MIGTRTRYVLTDGFEVLDGPRWMNAEEAEKANSTVDEGTRWEARDDTVYTLHDWERKYMPW